MPETLIIEVPPETKAADDAAYADTPDRYELEIDPEIPGGCMISGHFGDRVIVNCGGVRRLVMMLMEERDRLQAEVHNCPTCGMACKECRCVEARIAALESVAKLHDGAVEIIDSRGLVIDNLRAELALWRWLTDMACTVQQDSVVGRPPWMVLDVDGDVLGRGDTPEAAILNAQGN